RTDLMRRRFKRFGRYATLVPQSAPARGQVKAKKPPEPPKRNGVTWPINGGRPVRVSLGEALVTKRGKWLETEPYPQNHNTRLEPSRKKRVSPLVVIAEAWPKKTERENKALRLRETLL